MAIPTATDKVILIDFTLPETNVFLLKEYETNQQFSTLDVGSAFIGFKAPTETGLDGMTVKISLVNLDDDSFVNHTETIATATNHVALDNVYYYQVRRAELERQGKWIGRVSFVDNNGKTWGTRKFTFLIDGDILDVKRTKLYAIDSVEDFMEDMSALMLDFNGFITQMETNETTRGTTFTTTMTDFTNLFNQAQQLRTDEFNQAQSGRTGDFNASELSRTQTFGASEASRTTTFNASEASRGNTFTQNENARIGTFTQNENARQVEFDLGESTRNDGFDADHLRAGNDHTQAVSDSSRAGTDHTTATADHTQAGTDHTTAVNDHSTALTDHGTAQSDHTTALADHSIVQGYNTRLIAEETATANNKISAVKGKTFADVDARLEELETQAITVDARTEFEAKNEVVNGDFSNGATGWLGNPNFIVDGALKWKTAVDGFYNWYQAKNYPAGNKIYARMRVTNNSVPADLRLYVGSVGTNISFRDVGTKDCSGIITVPSGATHIGIKGQVLSTAVDTTIDNVSFIDLTATFGAGKEPTLAEMDRLMARYPNSWFDGTKPIQTIETLYQEKANKTKEAWITPTLTNGATGTVQYRKNEFGDVEFKGDVTCVAGLSAFTFPVGYRPTTIVKAVLSGTDNLSSKCVQIPYEGPFYINYPYGTQSCDLSTLKFSTT